MVVEGILDLEAQARTLARQPEPVTAPEFHVQPRRNEDQIVGRRRLPAAMRYLDVKLESAQRRLPVGVEVHDVGRQPERL